MDIVVPLKRVPDLVEELEIDAEGRDLDRSFLELRLSGWDEQAVEEALLLRDQPGARVTVLALVGYHQNAADVLDLSLTSVLARHAPPPGGPEIARGVYVFEGRAASADIRVSLLGCHGVIDDVAVRGGHPEVARGRVGRPLATRRADGCAAGETNPADVVGDLLASGRAV